MDNLSQIKRQRMLAFLDTIRQEHKDDDDVLVAINEIETELNAKKYGLVWEQHEEAVDVQMRDNIPVFTECEDKEITAAAGGVYNFILEGDNLHSLRLLEKTHRNKIKMIYIDPPYNTANKDFAYDDTRVDMNDFFRHSKWLSFMRERLRIAYNLLSDDGIIFISIDDNEQANLKLLCDEIFTEQNFFSQVIIQSNKRGQTYKQIAKTHEYLLIYTKSPEAEFNEIEKTVEDNDLDLQDEIGAYNVRELRNRNPKFGRFNRPNLFYPIYVNPSIVDKDGFCPISLTPDEGFTVEVYPYNSAGGESCWRWGQKLFLNNNSYNTQCSNVVARAKRNGAFNIYEKYRKSTYKAKSIWTETDVITEKGTVELGEMSLADKFPYPKPIYLIQKCIQIGTNEGDIILDFFAGSGTTGHAVLRQNMKDGGNRHFILCTNNENNICEEVTYERIKRVINGYGDAEGIPANLKYYRTDFVPKNEEYVSDALLEHIAEMIQLEHGIKLDGQTYIMVLDDEDADELAAHWSEYPNVKALYISKDVLLTTEQNALFKNVDIHIIPDYYFNFELREVGETW